MINKDLHNVKEDTVLLLPPPLLLLLQLSCIRSVPIQNSPESNGCFAHLADYLDGGSARLKDSSNTRKHNTEKKRTNTHASTGIRTHNTRGNAHLRPECHCDQRYWSCRSKIKIYLKIKKKFLHIMPNVTIVIGKLSEEWSTATVPLILSRFTQSNQTAVSENIG